MNNTLRVDQTNHVDQTMKTRSFDFLRRYSLLLALILEYAIFAILKPNLFLTQGMLVTVLGAQVPLIIVSLALMLTLITGEFDLSVGAVLVVVSVIVTVLSAKYDVPALVAVIVGILAGLLVGVINAVLVVYVKLNSLIVTIGMSTVLSGVALLLAGSAVVTNVPKGIIAATSTKVFGFPLAVYYLAIGSIIIWYVLTYTPIGRYLYLTGANAEVARLAGVAPNRLKFTVLVLSAGISSLAGILQAGTLGSADPTAGPGFLLPAFAAAFLGATAFNPGKFNVPGTIVASYLLIAGVIGLGVFGLTGWIQDVFNGAALLIALIISQLTQRKAE